MNEFKKKLSSRKFWVALCAFICALCALLGVDEMTSEKLVSTVSAFGVLAVYILTEGYLDSKSISKSGNSENETHKKDG